MINFLFLLISMLYKIVFPEKNKDMDCELVISAVKEKVFAFVVGRSGVVAAWFVKSNI